MLQTTIKMPFSAEPSKEARCVLSVMQSSGLFYPFIHDSVFNLALFDVTGC